MEQHERMAQSEKCYRLLQQSSAGLTAIELASKLQMHRTTVHKYLVSLELAGKAYSEGGVWKARKREVQRQSADVPAIVRRVFHQTDEIRKILFEKKNSAEALERMKFITAQLDDSMKKEMEVETGKVEDRINRICRAYDSLIQRKYNVGLNAPPRTRAYTRAIEAAEKLTNSQIALIEKEQREGTYKLLSKLYSLIYSKYPIQELIGLEGVKP